MTSPKLVTPTELVAIALECDPATLTPESRLNQHPKWDSLGHLNVMLALERDYGVAINDETIRRYEAMAAIVARHAELTAGA